MSWAWRIFWFFETLLLLPLALALIATPLAQLAGCYNFVELGCAAGLPDILGGAGFIGMILAIFTTPVALVVGVVGYGVYQNSISKNTTVPSAKK